MSVEIASNRVEIQVDASRHRRKCEVCNHAEKEEIERRFFRFEETKIIASEFNILHDSIDRHVYALGLRLKRSANTENVLEFLIARGIDKYSQSNKEMSDSLLAAAITEYDKITGKQKREAANPNDIEKAKEILDFHREHSKDFTEQQVFTLLIKPVFPQISAEELGVSVVVKGDEGTEPAP